MGIRGSFVKTLVFAASFALVFVPIAASQTTQSRRVALVIGNGAYKKVQTLANPANDAQGMAKKLESLGFAVTSLVDGNLDAMEKAREAFARDGKGKEVRLFFYAGHGVQSGGENWLLPVDADIKEDYELKFKTVSAQAILDGMEAEGGGVNIVILDACRDNPFPASGRSAAAERGLAVMGISGSLIAYATAPGKTASDGSGKNGVFTDALLAEIDVPGKSVQELMANVTARVNEATGGKQTPWINASLPRLFYFITPEEAKTRFSTKIQEGEQAVKELEAQIAAIKAKLGSEGDAAKRQSLEVEIKKQQALENQRRQETEALKLEKDRQAAAAKAKDEEAKLLVSLKKDEALRDESIRKAAEDKRKELEGLKAGSGSALSALLSVEASRKAKIDIEARYDSSLASLVDATGYDKRLAELAGWTMDPWENDKEFKARVAAERNRLTSEKQAFVADAKGQNDKKKRDALSPFLDSETQAVASLETAKTAYRGSAVKVEAGEFDRDEKFFPIQVSSNAPEMPYITKLVYSVKSDNADELKRRYLEFDGWNKAKALFGEIDTSVGRAGDGGFFLRLDTVRVKAVDSSGEKTLCAESPIRPIAYFTGSVDYAKPRQIGSYLSVSAPEAEITLNDGSAVRENLFILDPKPGAYSIKARLADGTVLEEKRNLAAGAMETVVFAMKVPLTVSSRLDGTLFLDGNKMIGLAAGRSVQIEGVKAGRRVLELRYQDGETEIIQVTVTQRDNPAIKFTYDASMVRVKGGSFKMGDTFGDGSSDEKPVREVRVSDFMIGKYEVRQREWVEVMGANPSTWKGDELPVEQVSWNDAVNYCNARSKKEGFDSCYTIIGTNVTCDFTKNGYRLPTEAEWEYAAKGGSLTKGYKYSGSNEVNAVGWYSSNSGSVTHQAGTKAPNELGLYDMTGNVWEWCWDWYGTYGSGAQTDPAGASSGGYRVHRGGSWGDDAAYVRSSDRSSGSPDSRYSFLGFRVLRRL